MVRFPVDSSRRPLFRRSCFLGAFVAALGLTSALAAAGEPHPFELTAFGGYRAGGRFEVEGGRLVLAEGVSFGASLGYHASPDMIVDFTYTCLLYTSPSPRD